ncbi:FCP1-like domain, HAD-like domain protein [Artemisia annua]|uniref:FCP1-like domain, HAD-like domain protein n=1 Tax=Artemisia annua TaxID=35608 RepID=A0A2U1LTR8_ARTAN|nr:FCP1-like domain, HAD-like domain protein [Artemisia annua]
MPSIKMTSGDSLKENNGLHVCQKSSKISKNAFSHVRNVQHEAELDTHDANKASVDEIRSVETNGCEIVDEETDCSTDHSTSCSSNIETIFSPILESIDIDIDPNFDDYGGRENDLILPMCGDNDIDDTSRKPLLYQTCNVSDLFFPDTFISRSCLLDYGCDESTSFTSDEYMLLPFLEDSIETKNRYQDCNVSEDSSIYVAIHQLKSCNQESNVTSYPDWDPVECLDPQLFIRNLLDLSGPSILPQTSGETKSVTLVLDLDETLVHSSLEHCDDADFTFPVFSISKEHTVYVKKRPHLRPFLEKVSEMFHIVVFTASQSIYAKKLLDILDPDGKIISRRAYRESCIFADGGYTKDLTVLGVDLAKVVIIDNSPQVFRLQVNNGIPIKSWFDDPSDRALISLLPFLETLVDAEDVRPIIAKRFGNKE